MNKNKNKMDFWMFVLISFLLFKAVAGIHSRTKNHVQKSKNKRVKTKASVLNHNLNISTFKFQICGDDCHLVAAENMPVHRSCPDIITQNKIMAIRNRTVTLNALYTVASVFQRIVGNDLRNEVLDAQSPGMLELRQAVLTKLRHAALNTTLLLRPTIPQSFDSYPEASSHFCDDVIGSSKAPLLTAVCLVGVPRSMTRPDVHEGLKRFLLGWGIRDAKVFAVLSAPNNDEASEFDHGHFDVNASGVEALLQTSE